MDWTLILKPIAGPIFNFLQARMGLNREHDVAIFKKLDAIANEARIDDLVNSRIYNGNLSLEDVHVMGDLIGAFNRIENRYLDSTVQVKAEGFAWELRRLLSFVQETFGPMPVGRLKFRPELIDRELYKAEWKELNERIDSTWETYITYRLTIKERLKI